MITFVVNSCRPRVVIQKYVHTFPDGDVECRPEMVKRRFRINRVKYVISKSLRVIIFWQKIDFILIPMISCIFDNITSDVIWKKTGNTVSRYLIRKWRRFQEVQDVNGFKNKFARMHLLLLADAKIHQDQIAWVVTSTDATMESLMITVEYTYQV